MISIEELHIEPLTLSQLREMVKMSDDGTPCLYDVEVYGVISAIRKKVKETKNGEKEYYSVTIRSPNNSKDYFIIHVYDTNLELREGKVIYAKGTVFRFNDFVFLSASTVHIA